MIQNESSWVSVANRINNIDSASDLASNLTFVASTEPEGDSNAAIYVTKKVVLENPATAIKVLLLLTDQQHLRLSFV